MKKLFSSLYLFALPVFAFAQFPNDPANPIGKDVSVTSNTLATAGAQGLFTQINAVINYVIPFLVGLAVLFVIWGVFSFISNAADEEARASAKQFIIWGIIGIFIMLSVWGLVVILANTFNLQHSGSGITTPRF